MFLSHTWPMRNQGLELADSITIDPHKWFYAPLDAGAILVKDEKRLTASFGMKPAYLVDEMDEGGERYAYYVHGFEQSRRFRSLKVGLSFKRYGAKEIGRWIDGNVDLAEGVDELCAESRDLVSAVEPAEWAAVVLATALGGNLGRAQTTERVSVATGGAQGNSSPHALQFCAISADARFVAFTSDADNLVAGDTNGAQDVFVRDRQSATTERVSVDTGGAEGKNGGGEPRVDPGGRRVVLKKFATN